MSGDLTDLAAHISSAAGLVNQFLVSNGHPMPSFDVNGPATFPAAPEEVMAARRQLMDAAQTIFELTFTPAEHLRWLACRVSMSLLRQLAGS